MGAGVIPMVPGSMHAMLGAMFMLTFPAFVICVAFTVMVYRRRDRSPKD